jgi:DNA (cytosine-5)-methyltransferase 1
MRFGSVCSGIEAASVAWHPLGWRAAWLAEIEPFPSAVLAHHYPEVPNHGDMTRLPVRILTGEVEAPDIFCGGTPCQAFSVAGLRQSLADERGNLSLTFCEIADAIDHVRGLRGQPPAIVFWENVPGVLSTADNAFGCFLAGLAGENDPLQPPGGKWTNSGCVYGPARAVAWRTLDAQYFGVAQRRRRVFVVASARAGFDPASVLFEWDGVRRDTAPSREAGKGTAHDTAPCLTSSGRGVERTGDTRGQDPVVAVPISIHPHCIGRKPESGPQGKEYLLDGSAYCMDSRGQPQAVVQPVMTMAHDQGGAEIATDRAPTLTCNHEAPIAFHPTQDPISSTDGTTHGLGCGSSGGQASVAVAVALRGREGGATAELGDEVQNCLRASQGGGDKPHVLAAMQVRRLTPEECEALQGFPRGYTAIPWRKKPADQCPDGPRYKALGNSWAVPVVRWIGQRISDAAR